MIKTKDSGIEWIGEIPEDWGVCSIRYLFSMGRGRVISQGELVENGHYPVYSSQTKNDGCMGFIDTYDYDYSQLTWTTDGANAGTVFLRKGQYNCTNVCGTLKPKKDTINLEYQKFAIEFISTYHKRADINGYKIMNNEMADIKTLIPPQSTQHQIADFLDKRCSKIDELIANNQSQIDKLKEYKQSVITQAVTKGLDPNVETKDSGIDWIGQIPKNWEVNRIKYCSTYNDDVLKEDTNPNTIINYVDIGSVSLENGIEHIEKYLFYNAPSRARRRTQIGDIIISTVRTYLKAIASINQEGLIVSTGFCVIRPNNKINKKYFEYFCKSDIFTTNVSKFSYGISYPAITSNILTSFAITEPNLNEQQQIADYLDKKCSQIDSLIEIKQQKIEKLQEYKKSLIYEYVTGKKEIC